MRSAAARPWLADAVSVAREALAEALAGRPPRVGIVLGSGLGPFADEIDRAESVATTSLPGFPSSTVPGHAGRLVAGEIAGVPVVVLKGRVHEYEGYDVGETTTGVQLMEALGVRGVFLTNAAGSVRADLHPGSLLLVRDHLRLGLEPIARAARTAGLATPRAGGRAHAHVLGAVHSERLREAAREAARALHLALPEGRLVYSRGPSYETAAEVRMYRWLGGHAACMSTVPEALVAHLLGLEVLVVSCITNYGTGLAPKALAHDEVTEVAGQVSAKFRRLLREIVRRAYAADGRGDS